MIVAISTMRDEADIARHTVEHLLNEGVDLVIVADNLSTDATRDELHAVRGPVEMLTDADPAFDQGAKMTELARLAMDRGARWVLPFDADEWWYSPHGTIADAFANVEADVLTAEGFDHIARPDDPPGCPFRTIGHRRPYPQKFPKVAFRPHPSVRVHDGNHGVDRPGIGVGGVLQFRHFQYRTLEQMTRKVRQGAHALDLAGCEPGTGAHWRHLASLDDEAIAAEWARLSTEPGLIFDPAP